VYNAKLKRQNSKRGTKNEERMKRRIMIMITITIKKGGVAKT
jgi:hypothetical protein